MNIILFEPQEIPQPLSKQDPRAVHILDVLRRSPGEPFDVGQINGLRGKAQIASVSENHLTLQFTWDTDVPAPEVVTLIAGLCRPQSCRRILREAATLGVARMLFPRTERGESTYADSSLWTTDEYVRQVRTGVEQAFTTQIPTAEVGMGLTDAISSAGGDLRIAVDNYEGASALVDVVPPTPVPLVLAVGSERGWSAVERDLLRDAGYQLAGMGARVLRAETAVIAALAVIKAGSGAWGQATTPDSRPTNPNDRPFTSKEGSSSDA